MGLRACRFALCFRVVINPRRLLKTPTRFCLGALFGVFVSTTAVQAQEWTRFRGPNGTGIGDAKGMPAEFSASNFEWVVKLPGAGHSSPVLWGDKIFLTVVSEEKKDRKVLCIDARTGKTLWDWNHDFEEYHKHNFNNSASSTPAVDDKAVYVTWASGDRTEVVALDHAGKELWTRSWEDFTSNHGSASSPMLVDGVLILHTDAFENRRSYVYGINPADGTELWSFERKTKGETEEDEKHITSYSTPVVVKAGNRDTVAVVSTNHGWFGLDPKNGEVVWSHPHVYQQRSVGSPASGDGILFASFGSGGGGKESTALKVGDAEKAEVLYELGKADDLSYVPSPIIYDGLLFTWNDGGIVSCRDVKTGDKIWQHRAGEGQFFSSPVLVDGKIYCGSRDGLMVVLAASKDYKKLGENRLSSGIHATPAIAHNRMFIRTDTHLMCLPGK